MKKTFVPYVLLACIIFLFLMNIGQYVLFIQNDQFFSGQVQFFSDQFDAMNASNRQQNRTISHQLHTISRQENNTALIMDNFVYYMNLFGYNASRLSSGYDLSKWADVDIRNFSSERLFYSNPGEGGFNGTYCYVTINGTNDTGQWVHSPSPMGYGLYRWVGTFSAHENQAGFLIQGLMSRNTRFYAAFEARLFYHVLRCITYDDNLCTQTVVDSFNLSDTSEHTYQINWYPGEVWFFIDETVVAHHVTDVPTPEDDLFFHVQACLSDKYPDLEMPIRSEIRDVEFLAYEE